MAAHTGSATVSEPIPVFKVAHRYMLYDVNVVTFLRREYNISGVLTGTLPQASQQNVFLGLPLELMPEEARLLVEKKVAYIVDDVAQHRNNYLSSGLSTEERKAFHSALRKQGQSAAMEANKRSDDRKKAALKKLEMENWNDIPDDMLVPRAGRSKRSSGKTTPVTKAGDDEALFGSSANPVAGRSASSSGTSPVISTAPEPYAITPTTSYPPLQSEKPVANHEAQQLPEVPPSYPLYKQLHNEGYFLAPGLRFGCQYMAYPGDPLRFHSHFLCSGMDWDQEFDLLDLVGGGRLGTGVKKGFLIGGEEKSTPGVPTGESAASRNVRAFCIEWGGM